MLNCTSSIPIPEYKRNTSFLPPGALRALAILLVFALAFACTLLPSFAQFSTLAYAADTAELHVGGAINYGGYLTHDMSVEGQTAYCGNPSKATPTSGSYTKDAVTSLPNNRGYNASHVIAALYYGYGGPGFNTSQWPATYFGGAPWTDKDYQAVTHIILSDFYACDQEYALKGCSVAYKDWVCHAGLLSWDMNGVQQVGALQQTWWTSAQLGEVPQSFTERCFQLNTGGATQNILCYTPGGGAELQKVSENEPLSNGNRCYSLAGAIYGIYDDGDCTNEVGTFTTDESGYASIDMMDPGDYWVRELTPSEGFALDTNTYTLNVPNGGTGHVTGGKEENKVYEIPQNNPADMWVGKVDYETTRNLPQGSATLAGAQFKVRYYDGYYDSVAAAEAQTSKRTWVFETDEQGYAKLDENYFVSGDNLYYDTSRNVTIPLGTILVQEITAPEGYLLTDPNVYLRKVTSQGVSESVHTYSNPIIKEEVYRGDIEFVKGREADQVRLPYIPFRITSLTTGESHVIVTDQNGEAKTNTSWNAHNYKMNANDAAVDANGNVDESRLDPDAGVFFWGTRDPQTHQMIEFNARETRGALPYDTYLIEELLVSGNDHLNLVTLPVVIYKHAYTIDMGTLDDQTKGEIAIVTSAREATSGEKVTEADYSTKLIDRVQYIGVAVLNEEYELRSTLMDADTGEPVVDANGEPVTGTKQFMLNEALGYEEIELDVDTRPYAGHNLVFFEELVRVETGDVVADHKDINDHQQTVKIKEQLLFTQAFDPYDKDQIVEADKESAVTDKVRYKHLTPGLEYKITGTLMLREIEDGPNGQDIICTPHVDDDGNPYMAEVTFTPEYPDGEIEVLFEKIDMTKVQNRNLVIFEVLSRDDEVISRHEDPYDEDQCFAVQPQTINSTLIDVRSDSKTVTADSEATIKDKITYKNVIPGVEYTFLGLLVDPNTGNPILTHSDDYDNVSNMDEFITRLKEIIGLNGAGTEQVGKVKNISNTDADTDSNNEAIAEKDYVGTDSEDTSTPKKDATQNIIKTNTEKTKGPKLDYPHNVKLSSLKVLMDENPEIASRLVWAKQDVVPEETQGTLALDYELDARGLEGSDATSCVMVVRQDTGTATSSEIDLQLKAQTVSFAGPEIGTYAFDNADRDKSLLANRNAVVLDEVSYSGLTPGLEYVMEGVLYDKETGAPLKVADKTVDAVQQFTPNSPDGMQPMKFEFDATQLNGHTLVCYEYLYRSMVTENEEGQKVLVVEHADLESEPQTVTVGTPPPDSKKLPGTGYAKTGEDLAPLIYAATAVFVIAGAAFALAYLYNRKKKTKN